MDLLTIILSCFTIASILGATAAIFYSVRSSTIIKTLRESNDAYKERNQQLEDKINQMTSEHTAQIGELTGRLNTLEKIKTPPLDGLFTLIQTNHTEVMTAIATAKETT